MNHFEQMLAGRQVPDPLKRADGSAVTTAEAFEREKEAVKTLLQEQEYGVLPPKPEKLTVRSGDHDPRFCAGKATLTKLHFTAEKDGEAFTFPVYAAVPTHTDGKIPAFVMINFRPDVPDKYLPSEEIIDRGYAVFSFCYKDISSDTNDFTDAGARFLVKDRTLPNASGKIMLWAWAAMRVMDYLETREDIDLDRVAVIGHSRLGKTALVTGAFDERFPFAISNDSGCCGAALTRGKAGEQKEDIVTVFPHWFCPRYLAPTKAEDLPFDQNYLLSLIVPRHIFVGSAEEDLWSDPASEFLCLYAVNPVYALYGKMGLPTPREMPTAPAVLAGDSYYQLRRGMHYFSREDWQRYMDRMDAIR